MISQPLLQGRKEEARKLAGWYRDLFDGRFYLELQDNGLERQQELNRMLVELAEEMELPLIASNDCFYLESREAEAQHILWLMGMQSRVTDEGVPEMQGNSRQLRTEEEMRTGNTSCSFNLSAGCIWSSQSDVVADAAIKEQTVLRNDSNLTTN